ncbi:EthD family reductase [Intrasporangium calvum]|uniref:EthD family reductase n=1 Tax=Intrasporangium calvum TaxID=53358 RepID=A0ABT5GE29_9MICO|nr:EthD family reductase [Intrasporangium calvum]MDC5696516.1 EthD family reductase [Intrasporangium calvum]
MYKVVVLVIRKEGTTRDEFLRSWRSEHPRFVEQMPGILRYRQSPAIQHKSVWPFDGMAELWFASLGDIAAAFKGPEAKALFDHEEHFIGDLKWFVAEEFEVPLKERT